VERENWDMLSGVATNRLSGHVASTDCWRNIAISLIEVQL
jgi:hypothetical protein